MEAVYIQTLASPKGSPDWKSVYHTLGKMTDLQNAREETNRGVIIERGQDGETQRAATALSQAAKVVIYDNEDQIRLLAA